MATATLMGTIVGAGILGIPYAVAKVGFGYGFLLIVLLGLAFLMINLFLGEVVLRTKGLHQLPGYAEKYLGGWGKGFMAFSMFLGLYGALTAYLIGEGTTLSVLFNFGEPWWYILLFFAVGGSIVYMGVRATGKIELTLMALLYLIVVLIGVLSFDSLNAAYFKGGDAAKIFLPYGIILFSYAGFTSIPEVRVVLGKDSKKFKKALVIGSTIPIILYVLFTTIVLGIVGLENFEVLADNERIATIALSIYANPLLGWFANALAVLSMFTSFLTISLALVDMYVYDFTFRRKTGIILAVFPPLLLALFNLTTFISVLAITGGVGVGLAGILIVLMHRKAIKKGDRQPEFSLRPHLLWSGLLILMFVVGMLYHLLLYFWD